MNLTNLFVAVALWLIIEGGILFASPGGMRKLMLGLAKSSDRQLSIAGLCSLSLGLMLLFFLW